MSYYAHTFVAFAVTSTASGRKSVIVRCWEGMLSLPWGGRWGEQTQGHNTTVNGQLHSGTALASAPSEQHKSHAFCPNSMEFTPMVTCHPGSAALSLQVGTALHGVCLHFCEYEDTLATVAIITVIPSSLCHLEKQKAKKNAPIASFHNYLV